MENNFDKKTNKWLVAVSVFMGAVMSTIDTFILYIATPHLRGVFSSTISEISWISTSFSVSALVVMLMSGWLCNQFGRKKTYQAGLIIFVIASIFCAMSTSLTELVIFRIIQGIGAGILVPVENVILRKSFPVKEHGLVYGIYGATVMIGPSLGPILGGIIIDNYHWSLIFYVNVPIGILAYMLVHHYVPHDKPEKLFSQNKFDWIGIVYLIVGIFCLIWLLERGDRLFWFEEFSNIILLFISMASLMMFVAHELVVENPAVYLRVFKNKIFTLTIIVNSVLWFVVTATLYILPLYMQEVLNFSPTKSGEALAPRALFMMVLFPIVGYIVNKTNPKYIVMVGLVIGVISGIQMSMFTHETGLHNMLLPQILQGIAVVLVFVPMITLGLRSVESQHLAAASSMDSTLRQLGGSLGIAVFSSLLTYFELSSWNNIRHNVSLSYSVFFKRFDDVIEFFILRGSSEVIALEQARLLLNWRVTEQVLVISYMNLFQIISLLYFTILLLVMIFNFKDNNRYK